MPRRFFTVAEVDRLVPTLERTFVRILQLRAALRGEERKLERAGITISREVLERVETGESPAVRNAKAMFRGFYETLSEQVGQIDKLGGEVKDIELGLVDFPGRRGSEEILLCWKLGESAVGHWHATDAGFGARRPINELIPGTPSSAE